MSLVGGVDYSQYPNWDKVVAPTGATYYAVPGTGYVYDPFLSAQKGRPVLFVNPRPALDDKAKAEAAAQAEADRVKQQQSFTGQVLPVGAGLVGTVGGAYAVHELTSGSTVGGIANVAGKPVIVMQDGTIKGAADATQAFSQNFAGGGGAAGGGAGGGAVSSLPGAAPNGATAIGQNADGSLIYNLDPVPPAPQLPAGDAFSQGFSGAQMPIQNGFTLGNIASAAAAAKGTYDTIQGLQHGGKGLRPGLTTAGAGIGNLVAGPAGGAIGAVAGNLIGYGLQGTGWKNDAALIATTGPIGLGLVAARHLGFNPVHKTTKQFQQERWGELEKDGVANAGAAYQANHPEGDTGAWQTGPYAGQKWTFEKANELAKQDPSHFQFVLGNFRTFGNDWNALSSDQQKSIVSRLVGAGLYKSDHGDVLITDDDAARKIKDEVLGPPAPAPAAPESQKVYGIPRSSTISPGIGLDGQRVGAEIARRQNERRRR